MAARTAKDQPVAEIAGRGSVGLADVDIALDGKVVEGAAGDGRNRRVVLLMHLDVIEVRLVIAHVILVERQLVRPPTLRVRKVRLVKDVRRRCRGYRLPCRGHISAVLHGGFRSGSDRSRCGYR